MPSVQQHHELALYRRHSLAAAGLVLLCYKRLSLLRMMARAAYCGEDECRPSEDPDVEDFFRLVWAAVGGKRPIRATYHGRDRWFCPHRLGRNREGQVRVLC